MGGSPEGLLQRPSGFRGYFHETDYPEAIPRDAEAVFGPLRAAATAELLRCDRERRYRGSSLHAKDEPASKLLRDLSKNLTDGVEVVPEDG